ncbi:MFS transporter [Bradyrhizobium sp.]|uniref:MFS transporter n=1 Tax=Bradyrhizobium sp. TaxID=376 RepID=UPI003C4E5AF6
MRSSVTAYRTWRDILAEHPPARLVARRPYYRWLVVGTVCIGAFMGQLDASIAQLVLPVLEREFHHGLGLISWVAIAYTLTLTVLLPVFGRVADLYGRKTLYTVGFLLFVTGSGLCGIAPDLPFLIGFRIFQAVGAALLQTNSIAIVVSAAGEQHRGRAIGLQSAAQAVGLSAGPAIGGLLIHALSWRWIFWINVPIGLLGAIIGWLVLPQTKTHARGRQFDWRGALLLAPALTALVLAINQGHAWGIRSPAFLCCAFVPPLLLPLFIWRENRQRAPLLDTMLFRQHVFWAGNLAGLLSYAMLFGVFFLMPFVFERSFHEDALAAGFQLMAVPAFIGLLSPLSGALYDRVGPRLLATAGMLLSFISFVWLALALRPGQTAPLPLTLALALLGIGQGLFTSPNNSSVMAAAPEHDVGQAGGILNVTRSFGTSVGVAAAAAVLAWRLGATTGRIGDSLHAPPEALLSAARVVLAMFAIFALIAAALSCMRREGERKRRGADEEATI